MTVWGFFGQSVTSGRGLSDGSYPTATGIEVMPRMNSVFANLGEKAHHPKRDNTRAVIASVILVILIILITVLYLVVP